MNPNSTSSMVKPKISVITPVMNASRFIEQCLRRVIDQQSPEIEHIIVDGLSNDGTVEIIRRYANAYPHIKWISEKDLGQSDAMNKGISLACGKILGFLNVDDYYEPGVLNRVIEIFASIPEPSFVVGNCNVRNNEGNILYENTPRGLGFTDLLLGTVINPHPINPSAYFYHKSLHQRIGLFNLNENYALDLDFILRAVQVANIIKVNETWGNFCMVQGSKTLNDSKTNEGKNRTMNMLKLYRRQLPLFSRLKVALGYFYYSSIWEPVNYFWKRPHEIPWRTKARILRFLKSLSM